MVSLILHITVFILAVIYFISYCILAIWTLKTGNEGRISLPILKTEFGIAEKLTRKQYQFLKFMRVVKHLIIASGILLVFVILMEA